MRVEESYVQGAPSGLAPATVIYRQPVEPLVARGAIVRALEGRRYQLESEEGSRLVARLTHRRGAIRVAIDYTTSQAVLTPFESSEVDDREWQSWSRALTNTINDEIDRAARAAAPPPTVQLAPATAVFARPATPDVVRAAVARALRAHQYQPISDANGQMQAILTHRRGTLRVVVAYTGSQATVTPVEARDVDAREWAGWARNLTGRIEEEVGRPERDAMARQEEAELVAALQAAQAQELERQRIAAQQAQAQAQLAQAQAAQAQAQQAQQPQIVIVAPQVQPQPGVQAGYAGPLAFGRGQANFGTYSVVGTQLVSPIQLQVVSGGDLDASRAGLPNHCRGFVTARPDLILQYASPSARLAIHAQAAGDTTLVVRTPSGQIFCSDDEGGGTNPLVDLQRPMQGTYEVWVGSYNAHEQLQSTVSVYDPSRPVAQTAPAPAPQAPDCRTVLLQMGHNASSLMFCDGAEPYCAEALLRRGHSPSGLTFCRGVQPQCAVTLLNQGQSPSGLMHCR